MIVLPDGKVCRNLPEQVAENLKKIQEIIHFLDGVNIQDNLVVIADLSQILTEAELEIVERPVAFIYYNAELYIKKNEAAGVAYFVNVFSIEDTGTQLNFTSNEMQVNLGTGALSYTTATATSYTKSQIDSLLALKADLSGAIFTGDVKAPTLQQQNANFSINLLTGWIENSAALNGLTVEHIYNRCEEINGVIYIVINFKLTNNTGSAVNLTDAPYFMYRAFSLDNETASKLFDLKGNPFTQSTYPEVLGAQGSAELLNNLGYGATSLADGQINFMNASNGGGGNGATIFLRVTSPVSIPDGQTRWFCGRMFLTLI